MLTVAAMRASRRWAPFFCALASVLGACSTSSGESGAGNGDAGVPQADLPPELGRSGRAFVAVGTKGDGLAGPTALAFAKDRPAELWVVNQATNGVVVFHAAGEPDQRSEARVDRYAEHFMMKPTSLAFGTNDRFATCSESRDEWNDAPQAPDDFMGPTLWSADLEIFARVGQAYPLVPGAKEGSHLDMLHESPLCMGIAHERDAVFWAFDGLAGNLVRYDFVGDHGPGGADHSDGRAVRYTDLDLARVPGVASHMVIDGGWLYLADTGHGRVLRVDIASGTNTGRLAGAHERLAEYSGVAGAKVETVVSGLGHPSGVAVHDGKLFVSDHTSGEIIAYRTADNRELGRVDTARRGIMGLAFGADGRLWIVSHDTDEILRLDPTP